MLAPAPAPTDRLSAVVPTLDEEREITSALAALAPLVDEIVVSDGGSSDATRDLAAAAGALVVAGPPGRGGQLNRGAAAASGELLLFVHADSRLPQEAPRRIREAIAGGAAGGAFEIRFDADGWRYRLGERIASRRSRRGGLILGDQSFFVSRRVFDRIGGFPDWPLLEDVEFGRRIRAAGPVALLAPPVVTSARRFERLGPIRTVLRNWWILLRFRAGASPHRLARAYRRVR